MWLIVGLGNPGTRYERTRHNIGFLCVERLVKGAVFKSEHRALVSRVQLGSETVLIAKPQTFMNLSGESVRALMHFYKIENSNLLIVHDEADLPFLRLKVQKNRGAGGHNGLKSINQMLGTQDYVRIKMGVGRPAGPMDTADYVLQNFSKEENAQLSSYFDRACQAIETVVLKGPSEAATLFNQKTETESEKG